ncbi:major facilitator superfamily domain-containing protein [Gongronella butleri]|nr:major facilitator superfamily domain-containing protein [Gongronella butleri]
MTSHDSTAPVGVVDLNQIEDGATLAGQASEKSVESISEVVNEKKLATNEAATDDDEGANYLEGSKLAFVVFALCLVVFCVALDNTIIATAIPKITDSFHALNDVGWYSSAYLLCSCAFQLLFGKFYARFNKKYVFLTGLFLFEIGSVLCGAAPNSICLIVGRAVAGLGAAGLFSGAMIIIAHSVPLAKRPYYSGLIGGMFGIASVIGPLLGGAFTDAVHATWRWCFYINLPFGGITAIILMIWLQMPATKKKQDESAWDIFMAFDPLGTITFVPGIICLLLALQWGGTQYAWNDGRIIALFVMFGVLISTFIGIQIFWSARDDTRATVPVRIASKRSIFGGALFGLCLTAGFMSFVYFLPIWFQAVKGTTAVQSGIDNLPLILSQTLGSIASGVLISQIGYYVPFMYAAPVFGAIGAGLITTFQVDTPTAKWIGYQILFGFGCGLGFQQPSLAAQAVLPLSDVSIGVSFVFFIQMLGGALFTSVSQNIFTNNLVKNIIDAGIPIDPRVIISTGATELQRVLPATDLPAVIIAYNGALTKAFQVSMIMACLSILFVPLVEWKSVKGKEMGMGGH